MKTEADLIGEQEREEAVRAFVEECNRSGINHFFNPKKRRIKSLPNVQFSLRMARGEGKTPHKREDFGDNTDQGSFYKDGDFAFVLSAKREEDEHPTLIAIASFNLTRTDNQSTLFPDYIVDDEGREVFPRILQLQGLTKDDGNTPDRRRELAINVFNSYKIWDGLIELVARFAATNGMPAVAILPTQRNINNLKLAFNTSSVARRYNQNSGFNQETPKGFYIKRLGPTKRQG